MHICIKNLLDSCGYRIQVRDGGEKSVGVEVVAQSSKMKSWCVPTP